MANLAINFKHLIIPLSISYLWMLRSRLQEQFSFLSVVFVYQNGFLVIRPVPLTPFLTALLGIFGVVYAAALPVISLGFPFRAALRRLPVIEPNVLVAFGVA
jgi:hypothetical protein